MADSKKSRQQGRTRRRRRRGRRSLRRPLRAPPLKSNPRTHPLRPRATVKEKKAAAALKTLHRRSELTPQSESRGEEMSSPAIKKMDYGRKGSESQKTTKKNDEAASLKQKGFTNKWSDEDELKVLQSLVDMGDENDADFSVTSPDWNLIYGYMSKISDWDFKFEKRQLCDKVHRLQIAFEKLGDAPAFSNVHKKSVTSYRRRFGVRGMMIL